MNSLSLHISPCPNDTFSFYQLLHHQPELKFEVSYTDVQALNQSAMNQKGDVLKISFATYPLIQKDYIILNSGAALGQGCGPLFVGREKLSSAQLAKSKIAIPGVNTTAYKLFKKFYPTVGSTDGGAIIPTSYEKIVGAIISKEVDAGVIIHENRFTYQESGLQLLGDLGLLWEQNCSPLLPLGGIVIKRSLAAQIGRTVSAALKHSIEWAFKNKENGDLNQYIVKHAQEMEKKIVHDHIDLYVNRFSLDLGEKGKQAIESLLSGELDPSRPHFINEINS